MFLQFLFKSAILTSCWKEEQIVSLTDEEQIKYEAEYAEYIDLKSRQAYWYEELERLALEEQLDSYLYSNEGPGWFGRCWAFAKCPAESSIKL